MADWFQTLDPDELLGLLALTALAIVGAGALIAHVPVRMPGPVSRAERASFAARGHNLAVGARLLLVLAAWGSAVMLLFPPREPEVIVLWSRARGDAVDFSPKKVRGFETPTQCAALLSSLDQRKYAVRDVGSGVDGYLRRLDKGRPWKADDLDARRTVSALVGEDLTVEVTDRAKLGDARPAEASLKAAIGVLPRWLVESIELSAVLLRLRQRNVKAVFVAPGRSEGTSGWQVLAAVLKRRGVELCLIDPPNAPVAGLPSVTRITAARSQETGTFRFWGLVEGRAGDADADRNVDFTLLTSTGTPVRLSGVIPRDERLNRLLRFCSGQCAQGADTVVLSNSELAAVAVKSSRERGGLATITAFREGMPADASATILAETSKARPARLSVAAKSVTDASFWTELLALEAFPSERLTLGADLEAQGLTLPQIGGRQADARSAVLLDTGDLLVVAASQERAERATGRVSRIVLPPNSRQRVTSSVGPRPSSSSWINLMAPASRLPMEDGVVIAGIAQSGLEAGHLRTPSSALVSVVNESGEDPAVLIDLDARAARKAAGGDPFVAVPIAYTLAWAVDRVARGAEVDELSVEEVDLDGPSAPLVDEQVLALAFHESTREVNSVSVAIIGLYFVVLAAALRGVERR